MTTLSPIPAETLAMWKANAEAATKGEWTWQFDKPPGFVPCATLEGPKDVLCRYWVVRGQPELPPPDALHISTGGSPTATMALIAEVKARQWQPIETAPKDGMPILIYLPTYKRQPAQEAWWAFEDDGVSAYWMTPVNPRTNRGHAPTHWMPLPQPPNPEGV